MMVNMRAPVSSCGALAMEMRAPELFRISLILLPPRPMMHPTMSDGILMFCVSISSPSSAVPAMPLRRAASELDRRLLYDPVGFSLKSFPLPVRLYDRLPLIVDELMLLLPREPIDPP